MSDQIYQIDTHVARKMGWHGKTTVRDKITPDNAFPAEPVLRRLYSIPSREEFLKIVSNSASAEEAFDNFMQLTRLSDYSQPFATDVNQFIGVPANPETYTFRSPQHALADMMDAANGLLQIESCVTLKNRSRYAISASVDGMKKITVGGREFVPYLTLSGAMDKSSPEVWGFATECVVCANTLAIALMQMVDDALVEFDAKGKPKKKRKEVADAIDLTKQQRFAQLRHSKGMHSKLEQVKMLIESALHTAGLFEDSLKILLKRPVRMSEAKATYLGFLEGYGDMPDDAFSKLLEQKDIVSTRRKNEVDGMTTLFARGLGNKGENALDLLSGLTERFTRGNGDLLDDDSKVKLWQSSEGGLYQKQKSDFFTLLQQPSKLELTAKRGELVLDRIGGLATVLPDILGNKAVANTRSLNAQLV